MSDSAAPPAKVAKVQPEENGKNPTEVETKIQEAIERIDDHQNQLEQLNEQSSQEILKVEAKYNVHREPHYQKRAKDIQQIPAFWARVFMNHPHVNSFLTENETKCLESLKNLYVVESSDLKSGYKLTLTFDTNKNEFFSNETLERECKVDQASGQTTVTFTPIQWKKGVDFVKDAQTEQSDTFFSWFTNTNTEGTGAGDTGAAAGADDELGETIKDDLWSNPLQYFLADEEGEDEEEGEEDEDEENEGEDGGE